LRRTAQRDGGFPNERPHPVTNTADGKFVAVYTGWNPQACAVAMFLITTVYVLLGGLYSVVITDIIQLRTRQSAAFSKYAGCRAIDF
jgi:hypothetical protein